MKFVDEVRVEVRSGDGGRGCVSFRREKFVEFGGPNGGDGGDGGSVWLLVDPSLSTLLDFRYKQHYRAGNGEGGMGKDMHGKKGAELEIRIPVGTLVEDDETGEPLYDLTEPGARVLLFKGGMGGRGNARFATSTNRAPRHAQPGMPGEGGRLKLTLKLLADVGLVGLPNAGKSTLISAVSAAKPKIADYPFTTLVPNLGVVRYGSYKSFVMADIPGLIEGASEGHGLGTRFLKHVERTDLFVHLVDLSSMQEGEGEANFDLINRELTAYDAELARKTQFVALSKIDLPEVREMVEDYRARFEARGYRVFPLSAVTGEGVRPLVDALGLALDERRRVAAERLDRGADAQ